MGGAARGGSDSRYLEPVKRFPTKVGAASAFWLTAAALIAFQALWPADAPWINDEPGLIYKALRANQVGELETVGLMGSVGFPYGPHVTWIYQGALLLTHDLVAVVVVKSLLTAVILLWGLLEIGRAANLRRPIALLALLSPFLFFYGRVLWDNVFLLPASALLFAAAARCFRRPSLLWWSLGVFSAYLLFHIHLMSMFVIVPALAILPLACWPWLRENWGKALAPIAVARSASSRSSGGASAAVSHGASLRWWYAGAVSGALTSGPSSIGSPVLANMCWRTKIRSSSLSFLGSLNRSAIFSVSRSPTTSWP